MFVKYTINVIKHVIALMVANSVATVLTSIAMPTDVFLTNQKADELVFIYICHENWYIQRIQVGDHSDSVFS